MVSPELAPYARASEAADSVASLAKALRQLGHEVTVAAPRYPAFEEAGLLVARRLTPVELAGGGEVTVFDGQLASGVKLVLFDSPGLLDRPEVYSNDGNDGDDAERFGLFARATVGLIRQRAKQGSGFDVVHLHDWPAALVPMALRAAPGATPPTVLTVHDVTRQGDFDTDALEALGIPQDMRGDDGVLLDDRVNVLKGAILHADAVTTVSSTYAIEMRTKQRAGSLAGAVLSRVDEIVGITDGIDYAGANPATDAALARRYDAEDSSAKGICKTALIRELGLDIEPSWPVFAALGPVTEAMGFDVIGAALTEVAKDDAIVVVAGEGDLELISEARAACGEARIAVLEELDDAAVRRIYSAADLVLLAPRHAPCGTSQLMAQRYGALPVAHATGGLRDTIVDCDGALETGTGFLFDELTAEGLLGAIRRGFAAYRSEAWPRLRRRVMRLDVGWDRPARRYAQVYRNAAASR